MKISEIKLPRVVGVAGFARSGKDTFCTLAQKVFSKTDTKIMRSGFANAVKADLHQLLVHKVGISAYTDVDEEKALIRPLLVEYGTGLMRKLNPRVWINRMQPNVDLAEHTGCHLMITDVRYENEVDWILEQGGKVVYIDQEGCSPANKEEKKNDPPLREKASTIVSWEKVGDDKLLKLKSKVTKALKELSC